jgi:MoaA/NifB/PqqE/SkfB family radical SAM enzyme
LTTAAAFPTNISLTITNRCNLRCRMCGQWSEEGYMHDQPGFQKQEMALPDWMRLVDELAEHGIPSLLLRGGEPFLFPGIIELLEHIHRRGLHTSIDTNGTLIARYAAEIACIGGIHLTISVDGPEEIHDALRGVKGTFARLREGINRLKEAEQQTGNPISLSGNYTISQYNLNGLGDMPEVARSLGLGVIAIVPYYYFPEQLGKAYEAEMQANFGCPAYSWRGFHHESSGVDFAEFQAQWQRYKATLGEVYDFPYLALSEEEYRTWFNDAVAPVGLARCSNVEKLIDIQPNGDANFCVDFPDFVMGNVRQRSIAEVWNSAAAERFRAYRRAQPLAVCHRCGAKYMSEMNL